MQWIPCYSFGDFQLSLKAKFSTNARTKKEFKKRKFKQKKTFKSAFHKFFDWISKAQTKKLQQKFSDWQFYE